MDIDTFLHDLALYGRTNDIPNVSPEVGRFLADMVRATDARRVMEIGTANGYSTIWLARALAEAGGHITTIDFSRPTSDMARDNIDACGLTDITEFVFANALAYLPDVPDDSYDMVFIDGQKRTTREFFAHALRIVRPRGVIIIDDVIKYREKMGDFFDSVVRAGVRGTILPIDGDDGVMMVVR